MKIKNDVVLGWLPKEMPQGGAGGGGETGIGRYT
jgi:hypothetical protein